MLAAKEKKQGVNTCRKRDEAVSGRVGSSSLQVGSCLTPATNLPKAAPLDSRRAFGAALLTLSKRQERQMENGRRQTDFKGGGRSDLPPGKTKN